MQATYQEQHSRINTLVQGWDRRYRWQQTIYWLPISLLPGLLAGLVLLLAARLLPLPPSEQLLTLAAVIELVGVLVMVGLVWLRPRSALESARRFDLEFDLGERLSTALELIDGRIQGAGNLVGYQIDDAWAQGQTVNARDRLPLRWNRRGWTLVLVVIAAVLLLLILPNPQQTVNNQAAPADVAIDEAVDEVERITEEIAADSVLPEEARQQLLEELEQTNEILEEEEVTPEEAFAALSDAESQLEEQSEQLSREAQAQQEALEDASQALQENTTSPEGPGSGGEGQQEIPAMLEEMQQGMEDMGQQQMDQMADALEQAADALEETNPEAAQALRDAAEALRNGDQQAAQEAMQQAAESLQQQQQQAQQQQQSADQLQQQSDQLQQAADQVAQQGQEQPQERAAATTTAARRQRGSSAAPAGTATRRPTDPAAGPGTKRRTAG